MEGEWIRNVDFRWCFLIYLGRICDFEKKEEVLNSLNTFY